MRRHDAAVEPHLNSSAAASPALRDALQGAFGASLPHNTGIRSETTECVRGSEHDAALQAGPKPCFPAVFDYCSPMEVLPTGNIRTVAMACL